MLHSREGSEVGDAGARFGFGGARGEISIDEESRNSSKSVCCGDFRR